jgi:histidine triad (HIT) family protein
MPCIFCEIAAGRVPARKVHEDDSVVAFHDLNPQAPTHLLVIPRKHIESLLALEPGDDQLMGALVRTARELAGRLGFDPRGFRLVMNCGDDAGYSVYHVHLHLLAGRALGWSPG